jgi:hypothetical protein
MTRVNENKRLPEAEKQLTPLPTEVAPEAARQFLMQEVARLARGLNIPDDVPPGGKPT